MMKQPPQEHLSDEQFTECVSGIPNAAAAAHLQACGACKAELKRFEDTFFDFGRVSEAWSQAIPQAHLRATVKEHRQTFFFGTAWKVATAAALAISIPLAMKYQEHAKQEAVLLQSISTTDDQAEIAADNQLMQKVFVALAPDDSTAIRQFQITTPTQSSAETIKN